MKSITLEEHFMSSRVKQVLTRTLDTNENMFQFEDHFVQNSLTEELAQRDRKQLLSLFQKMLKIYEGREITNVTK